MHYILIIALPALAMAGFPSIEDASTEPPCPANEHYLSCTLDQCFQPKTCSDLGKHFGPCLFVRPCAGAGGCVCNYGHVRNDEGICVPEDKCPSATCPDNEYYATCAAGRCKAKDCKDLGRPIACASIYGYCPGGCLCSKGYLRNEDGLCIKKEKCSEYKKGADFN